ncbi:MAG: SCO family protein [Pirellulales bacterium]|nr:SCO family protein [Pirellulales bacterium]
MNNSMLPYWLSLMVLLAASYGVWKWRQVEQFQQSRAAGGIEYTGPPLEEFQLTERSGKPFRSQDMRGKVWVASLFFSTCPGSCKKLNGNIKAFHEQEDFEEVTWVSISVDPDTDTLPVLQEYADSFHADPERWLFCRGDFKYVQRIGQDILGLPVLWKDHNDYGVVIDRNGRVRGAYDINRTSHHARLFQLIKECLAEEETPDNDTEQDTKEAA